MSWYVLHVRTGREPEIKAELKRKGYAAAVPTELRTERQGGVWRERERIVIPGYVFLKICLTDQDYYRVRGIPNVIRFLGSGRPEALREDEESYFTWLANEDAPLEPSGILLEGDHVTVMTGPLRGREGTILRINKRQRRATLAITMAGHQKEISLSVQFLKPAAAEEF